MIMCAIMTEWDTLNETEVVTHANEFLTTCFFLKFTTTSEKCRIIISLLFSMLRLVAKLNMAQVW